MNRQQREEFVRNHNGMTYQDKSNEIKRVFRDEIGLELFQRQDYTLAAMNVKTNTPYRMHPNLGGVNVGVSFKHDCKASIEVYFKDNFYQSDRVNPTFDVISEYFGGADITTTIKRDGKYLLF